MTSNRWSSWGIHIRSDVTVGVSPFEVGRISFSDRGAEHRGSPRCSSILRGMGLCFDSNVFRAGGATQAARTQPEDCPILDLATLESPGVISLVTSPSTEPPSEGLWSPRGARHVPSRDIRLSSPWLVASNKRTSCRGPQHHLVDALGGITSRPGSGDLLAHLTVSGPDGGP